MAIITLLLVFFYLIYRVCLEQKIPNKLLAYSIEILFIILISPLATNILMAIPFLKTHAQKNDEKITRDFQEAVTKSLVDNCANTEGAYAIIREKYNSYYSKSKAEANKSIDEFFRNIESKRAEMKTVQEQEEAAAQKYEMKWKPFFDYILTEFDGRIELFEQYTKLNKLKNSFPLLLVNNSQKITDEIRNIRSERDNVLKVTLLPGSMVHGNLSQNPAIYFLINNHYVFVIRFSEGQIGVEASDPKYRFIVGEGFSTKIDPLIDDEFREKTIDVLKRMLEQFFIEDK